MRFYTVLFLHLCLLPVFVTVQAQELSKEAVSSKWKTDQQWTKERYMRQEIKTKKSKNFKTGEFKNKEEITVINLVFIKDQSYRRVVEKNKKNKFKPVKGGFDWAILMQRFGFQDSQFEEYADESFHRIQFRASREPEPVNYYEEVASEMAGELKVSAEGTIISVFAKLAVDEVKIKFAGPLAGATVKEVTINVVTQSIEGHVVPRKVTVDYHVSGGALGLTLKKVRYQEVTEYTYIEMSPEEQVSYFNKINGKPKA